MPSIPPRYFNVPSNPRDSILTLSPTSNDLLPDRLVLRAKISDCLLTGRGAKFRLPDAGVRGGIGLTAEEVEATDGGLLTDWRLLRED